MEHCWQNTRPSVAPISGTFGATGCGQLRQRVAERTQETYTCWTVILRRKMVGHDRYPFFDTPLTSLALNKNVCYAIKRIEKNIAPQYTTRDTLYNHIERSLDAIGWNYIFLPGIRLSTTKRAIKRSILQSLLSKSVTQIGQYTPHHDIYNADRSREWTTTRRRRL
jgi:hypothetical protein